MDCEDREIEDNCEAKGGCQIRGFGFTMEKGILKMSRLGVLTVEKDQGLTWNLQGLSGR